MSYIFGPVPSRRLGYSLGINNLPDLSCTYACVYCQVANIYPKVPRLKEFYKVEDLLIELKEKLNYLKKQSILIDYITFVPDGEPTLDINLSIVLDKIKEVTNIPVAIITNGSLINFKQVFNTLLKFDWVSFKVDSVQNSIFKKLNRAHRSINLSDILDNIVKFSKVYKGKLNTETMLISGYNDSLKAAKLTAEYIKNLDNLNKAYITLPIRPVSLKTLKPINLEKLDEIYSIYNSVLQGKISVLNYDEGGNFFIDFVDFENSLISILKVHPIRLDVLFDILKKNNYPIDKFKEDIRHLPIQIVNYYDKKFIKLK